VKAGEPPAHIHKAAEKLRAAKLAVIKAKLALIRAYPARDPGGRNLSNLQDEELRWRSLSTEAIVEEFSRTGA